MTDFTIGYWFKKTIKSKIWMILALVFPAFMLGYVCAAGLMRFVLTGYDAGTTLLSPLLTSLLWSFIIVYLFALIISLVYAVICRLNNKVDVPKEVDEHKEKNKKWIIGGLFVGLILIGTFSGINLMGTILTPAADPISPVGTWEGNGGDSWAILKIYEDKQVMFVTQFYEPAKLEDFGMDYPYLIDPLYGMQYFGFAEEIGTNEYDIYIGGCLPVCDYIRGNGFDSVVDLYHEFTDGLIHMCSIRVTDEDRMVLFVDDALVNLHRQ